MTLYITIFLFAFAIFLPSYLLGVNHARKSLFKNITEDPDRIIGIINQIKSIQEAGEELPDSTEVYFEQHNDQFFVYNKATNLYLGQGSNIDDAMKTVTARFPTQQFFYEETD